MSPRGPEGIYSPDNEPRLKVIRVNATTVREAMQKAGESAAGPDEWDWVLKKENKARVAAMLTDGDYFFFPGIKHDHKAFCVYRDDNGVFKKDSNLLKHVWNSFDRIVVLAG